MFLIEDIMLAKQAATELHNDPVEEALAYHGGDARATIETLLEDVSFLRRQLSMASGLASRAFTRGWFPALDRDI